MDELDFIKELAKEHPITFGDSEVNYCKFCDKSWAEWDYEEYLKNEEKIVPFKDKKYENMPYEIRHLIWNHHDPECWWIRANQIVAAKEVNK